MAAYGNALRKWAFTVMNIHLAAMVGRSALIVHGPDSRHAADSVYSRQPGREASSWAHFSSAPCNKISPQLSALT